MNNSNSTRLKVVIFTLALLLLSSFYACYRTVHAEHHCDDSSHCHICITLSELLSHSPSPLGASLNKTVSDYALASFVFIEVFVSFGLLIKTPVSLHIKKSE